MTLPRHVIQPPKVIHIATVDVTLHHTSRNLLNALREAGYEVVTVSTRGAFVHGLEDRGIRHIEVPLRRSLCTPLADIRALWRLYKIIRSEGATIVHTHTLKAGVLGRLAARLACVPVVVHTSHGYVFYDRTRGIKRRLFVQLERLAACWSDTIFSVNRQDIETAKDEGIGHSTQMLWLGPGGVGLDLNRFDPKLITAEARRAKRATLGFNEAHKVVGFVGRLNEGKGLVELVSAMRLLRKSCPLARLLVIGPVDNERHDFLTEEIAVRAGISDISIFTGFRHDVRDLYALMDVFVLPSHSEGLPLSVMEACAMGKPCIVTDVRGCREVVEHGRNGLVVPKGDVEALAAALWQLLQPSPKTESMAAMARTIALERFDERPVFERVKSEYARLLRQKGVFESHRETSPVFEVAK